MTINIAVPITDADLTSLGEGNPLTLTLTPPPAVVVIPPPVTPPPVTPPVSSGLKIPVYQKGKFSWAGDWSGISINYAAVGGLDGVSNCIEVPSAEQFEYWLPYPPVTAGAPAANGIGCNLAGCTKMTLAVKPTKPGLTLSVGFYSATGTADDVPYGKQEFIVTTAAYGPAAPVADQWNVYTIPLADFGITPGWIYKFIVQEQGGSPQAIYLDQVGFE